VRKAPSRMTLPCPHCGRQLVVRLLLPIPEHRDTKSPQVVSLECSTPGCKVDQEYIRTLLRIPLRPAVHPDQPEHVSSINT
jgi:hypothetical protein